jgi:hypothetical protein
LFSIALKFHNFYRIRRIILLCWGEIEEGERCVSYELRPTLSYSGTQVLGLLSLVLVLNSICINSIGFDFEFLVVVVVLLLVALWLLMVFKLVWFLVWLFGGCLFCGCFVGLDGCDC